MKKINYKRLLALTVFTLINGYSVSQISANAELYHCESDTNSLHIAEITAPTPDAQTTEPRIQWEKTNVLVRALCGEWYAGDELVLSILNMPSVKDNFMQGLLAIFLNPTIIPTPITEETSDWFESARQNINVMTQNNHITCDQATICTGLLPDATVEELFKSAEKILGIEPTYVNAAIMCFTAIINHPDATVEKLFESAEKILKIEPRYVNAAIMCFTAIQNHPDASIEDLITAGQEIIDIGEEYHTLGTDMLLLAAELPEITPNQIEEIIDELTLLIDMSPEIIEQLCHQLFNHPESSRMNKIQAADYLQNLGIHHYKQVSEKLNQLLDITNNSAFIAMKIGETFEKMGKEYYASALNAFNKAASIAEIASEDSPLINQCLARINEKIANLSNK